MPVLDSSSVAKIYENKNTVVTNPEDEGERGHERPPKEQKKQREPNTQDKQMEFIPSHFIGIPIQDPIIGHNYDDLVSKVTKQNYRGVEPWMFLKKPLLHITIMMVDLPDEETLTQAKAVL